MNNRQGHWLSAFSACAHLLIGLSVLQPLTPPSELPTSGTPPSWTLIERHLPDGLWWLYPALFVLTGLVALAGVWHPGALRWGFRLSALCFVIWGVAGLVGWATGAGGNISGSVANLFFALALWVLGDYVTQGERGDKIDEKIVLLGEQRHQVAEALKVANGNGADPDGER